MVIDFHAHYPNEPDFIDRLVARLPEAGIDVICLCSAGEGFGHAPNKAVLEAAQKHSDCIIAFALIELGKDPPEQVDEYAAQGFRGFKITNPSPASSCTMISSRSSRCPSPRCRTSTDALPPDCWASDSESLLPPQKPKFVVTLHVLGDCTTSRWIPRRLV